MGSRMACQGDLEERARLLEMSDAAGLSKEVPRRPRQLADKHLGSRAGHACALAAVERHQPHLLQGAQGFPHGGAADPILLHQLAL